MSYAASQNFPQKGSSDKVDASDVNKRESSWDVATLNGYDDWSDEELQVKGRKMWASCSPSTLLPVEIASLFSKRGLLSEGVEERPGSLKC